MEEAEFRLTVNGADPRSHGAARAVLDQDASALLGIG